MISTQERLPTENILVYCRVEYWRHEELVATHKIKGCFLGIHPYGKYQIWSDNIEEKYGDNAVAEVTHWEPLN